MQEMHLKQSGLTYSACGPFLEKIKNKKNKETVDSQRTYQDKLHKAFFQNDMTYGILKI